MDDNEFDAPPVACADGIDNDGDGLSDYPNDPGCEESDDDDESNEPPPVVTTDLPAKLTLSSDWGAGYCADVSVTNDTAQSVEWTTVFTVQGSIDNSWNFVYTQLDDQVTANGVSWNKQLAPGASATFGFCAERPPSSPSSSGAGNIAASLTIQSDWGSGYCANVNVKNLNDTAVQWEISLEIEGHVNNARNALYSQNGAILTAKGVDWNSWVAAGSATSFGFCAAR